MRKEIFPRRSSAEGWEKPEALGVEVKSLLDDFFQRIKNGEISPEEVFREAVFLFGFLADGPKDMESVEKEVKEFLSSEEIQQAYNAGIEGREYEFKLLNKKFSHGLKGKPLNVLKVLMEFWAGNISSQPLEVKDSSQETIFFLGKIVFSDETFQEIIAGEAFDLEFLNPSLKKIIVGFSTLYRLREFLNDEAIRILKERRNITTNLGVKDYCQRYFSPDYFYILGFCKRIEEEISKTGVSLYKKDYQEVLAILSAILFSKAKGVEPPPLKVGFGRFRSTRKVFEMLNGCLVESAKTELKKVIVKFPWFFDQKMVNKIYGSGRIKIEELKQKALAKLPQGKRERKPKSGIEEDIRLIREILGEYPIIGKVFAWWEFGEEDKEIPNCVICFLTDPEGPSRLKRAPSMRIVEAWRTDEGWKVDLYEESINVFVGKYLEQGRLGVFEEKISKLSQRGDLPTYLPTALTAILEKLKEGGEVE